MGTAQVTREKRAKTYSKQTVHSDGKAKHIVD